MSAVSEGFNAVAGNLALRDRNKLDFAEYAERRENQAKAHDEMGKSADALVKSMDLQGQDPWAKMGMIESEYYNLSPTDRAGVAKGLILGQQYQASDAQEQIRRTGERDQAIFRDVLQNYGQRPAAPALDGETDTPGYGQVPGSAPDLDPKDFLIRFYQAGGSARGGEWASQAFKNLTGKGSPEDNNTPPEQTDVGGVPYVWKRGSREFQPRADYGLGVKQDNALEILKAKEKPAAEPGEQPITSPDGKFYWSGTRWVAVPVADPAKAELADMLHRGNTNAPAGRAPANDPASAPVLRFRKNAQGKVESY